MRVLHFGAGNIGRGFLGRVFSESGFDLIFSDINQKVIDAINLHKAYNIHLIGESRNKIININKVKAISINNPRIISIVSSVDLITTAVTPIILDNIAVIIAQGIILKIKEKSLKPMNIIACENKIKASSYLKKAVLENLPIKYYDYLNEYIGFVDCTIDTIIPLCPSDIDKNNKLSLIAEDFHEWIVNINQFKGDIPKIVNMQLTRNLDSFIERKLFTLNTGHAIAAYLGLIKKYKTVYESISDNNISHVVKKSMIESGSVLIKRFNFDKTSHLSYIEKIFSRFKNPYLSDDLHRIARNPLQKLGKEERLIKPLLGAIKYRLPCSNLVKGIAAVFHYYNENDIESINMLSLVKKEGIEKTLFKICSLNIHCKEIRSIISEYTSILK